MGVRRLAGRRTAMAHREVPIARRGPAGTVRRAVVVTVVEVDTVAEAAEAAIVVVAEAVDTVAEAAEAAIVVVAEAVDSMEEVAAIPAVTGAN